jgi:ABC-type glycerol-3-phosphate transport system substrate-binding protein
MDMKRLLTGLCCLALCAAAGCADVKRPSDRVEVWHWMTDRQDVLDELARQYEVQTGIKIKLELFAPSDTYIRKITAAAQGNALPEIYGVLDKKAIFASFIKAGLVFDLTPEFTADGGAWEKSLFDKALDVNRFPEGNGYGVKPGLYGVPLDVMNIQMTYNKVLLKKAGIAKAPATFDEFLRAVDALKRVGIAPFVTGFGETWIVNCFASNYALNIMGLEKIMATFRGEVPYTDPDWIRVFNVFRTLANRGAFMEGIVTKGNKYAEQDFALERAAFSFDGSWCVNVYKGMNPSLEYGVMPLPVINPLKPMQSWGGAGSSFVVNQASPNKDKAVAFLKWLTVKEQQAFFAEKTNNLPASREAVPVIAPMLADFARVMDKTTHPSMWPFSEDPLVVEAFDKGIQAIMIGEKTPSEVAAMVQEVKACQMGKIKK